MSNEGFLFCKNCITEENGNLQYNVYEFVKLVSKLLILCYRQYFNYTFNVKVSYAIFKFGITKIEIPAFAGITIIKL